MKRSSIKIMMKLIVLVKPMIPLIIIAVICGSLGFLSAIGIQTLAAYRITDFMLKDNVAINQKLIYTTFIQLVVLALFRGILRYIEQYSNHNLAFKILAKIRQRIFIKLRELSPAKLDRKDKGNLISLITQDIELLEVFYAHTISPVLIAIVVSLTVSIFILFINPFASIIALLSYITIGFLVPVYFGKKNEESGYLYREGIGNFNTHFLENIEALSDIKQYGIEGKRKQESQNLTDEMTRKYKVLRESEGRQKSLTSFVIMLSSMMMTITCYFMMKENLMAYREMLLICISFMSSFGAVVALSNLSSTLHQTLSAGDRILNLLEEKPQVVENKSGLDANFKKINIKNASFSYEESEQKIISSMNLLINKNEIIGIKGESGCGKSTLMKLLMRFYDTDTGDILFSKKNIKEIKTSALRENEGYFPQNTIIFNDTILENIRMFNEEITEEEVVKAAKNASLHDFISSLDMGYKTVISGKDRLLSDGEKQRLGLARTLLRKGNLLILDEPTANLDALNEGIILKTLKKLRKTKTILISSHRDMTLSIADRVVDFKD